MNAFDIIDQFFRSLNTEQALLLGILGVIVFMFGLLVGWIVQGTKTRRYKKELLLLRKDRDEYEQRYTTTSEENKKLAAELERISREKVEAFDQLQAARRELQQRDDLLRETQGQVEQLTVTNETYAATIDDLNNQVIGLKTKNEQLLSAGLPTAPGGTDQPSQPTQPDPGTQTPTQGPALDAYITAIESRFQAFEDRLAELDRENATLRTALGGATVAGSTSTSGGNSGGGGQFGGDDYVPSIGEPAPAMARGTGEPLIIRADTTDPGARIGHGGETEVIVETTPSLMVPILQEYQGDPDDLTAIDGIGDFLQTQLNEAGIYCYGQIADWSSEDIDSYAAQIGWLADGIRQGDWVGQAQRLQATKSEAAEADTKRPARGRVMVMVEGIGPKIEQVLTEADITSLEELADTPVDQLREILDAAGPNFRSKDPTTWPEQAALARDGKWDELQELQKVLVGGRRI